MSSLELLKRLHGEFLRLPGQEDFEPTRGVDSSEDLRGSAQITTLTDDRGIGWV
jgi:hypothetical protein